MSHQPERTEKNCLNCNTHIYGRFCHVCGQENVVSKQSFFSLAKHFVYDIFHFDGKFFETVRKLLLKPGQVPKEYTAGKRASFLDPIRMYLFTSAVFFVFFFALAGPAGIGKVKSTEYLTMDERAQIINELQKEIQKGDKDSLVMYQQIQQLKDTSLKMKLEDIEREDQVLTFTKENYRTLQEYDSIQNVLPKTEKDGWFTRRLTRKSLEINDKYRGRSKEGLENFTNTLLHYFPYILFLSLPFFAGTLKLLYIRKKNLFYSDHAVFTLYHYVFGFIALLLIFLMNLLEDAWALSIFNWIIGLLILWWILYLFMGMKRFYEQGWGKTFFKFLIQVFLNIVILIFLLFIFLIFSIFQL